MNFFSVLARHAAQIRRACFKEELTPLPSYGLYPDQEVLTMLRQLGVAMVETGQPTNLVEAELKAIARAYTPCEVRLLVFPTYLIVQLDSALTTKTQVDVTSQTVAQLHQAGEVDTLVQLAKARAVTPGEIIARAKAAREWPSRFGPVLTLIGNVVITVGFGLALDPTWAGLPAYILLGLVVGLVLLVGRWLPSVVIVLPPIAATIVTVLTTWYLAEAAGDGLLRVLAPSLICVLPGMTLAMGAMELTSTQVISGASRLVYGAAQLLLLALGVVVGVHIAGPLPPVEHSVRLGSWAPYVGAVVAATGFYLFKSAPKGSLPSIAATMLVALVSQRIGGSYLDPILAGFLGAFIAVPFAQFIGRFRGVPPPMVLLLAAFWFLVPGAFSFISVGEIVTTGSGGTRALVSAVVAIFSIALGMLHGWGVDYAYMTLLHRLRTRRSQRSDLSE